MDGPLLKPSFFQRLFAGRLIYWGCFILGVLLAGFPGGMPLSPLLDARERINGGPFKTGDRVYRNIFGGVELLRVPWESPVRPAT
jgi:hypothetical protein